MFGLWDVMALGIVCLTIEAIVGRICDAVERKQKNDIKY